MVIHRRYTTPTSQWDPVHRFSLFVRKDVAAQVWDWGTPAARRGGERQPRRTRTRRPAQVIAAVQQIGSVGHSRQRRRASSTSRAPWRWMARARSTWRIRATTAIQVFNPDGSFLRQWGSTCKLDTGEGCQGDGRGQFNEPWGIAVDVRTAASTSPTPGTTASRSSTTRASSSSMWGVFGSTGGELGKPSLFYGPRDRGRRGKTATSTSWTPATSACRCSRPMAPSSPSTAAAGVVEGRFDEPVGLAQDAAGNWYVADTWNRRIQKFDPDLTTSAQWPVDGWAASRSSTSRHWPWTRTRNIVYAVDPENYRVLAFNTDGTFQATWGSTAMMRSPSCCRPALRSGRMAGSTWPTATRTGS